MAMESHGHKANFEGDVWNAFNNLAAGHKAFLYKATEVITVLFIPPDKDHPHDHKNLRVMDVLLSNGLVEQRDDELIDNAEARYELTEKGRQLFDEIKDKPSEESERVFLSRIKKGQID